MKKIFLTLSFICLILYTKGQAFTWYKSDRFRIGAETGPSLIFLFGNPIMEQMNRPTVGFMGGFTFQYNITNQPDQSLHLSLNTGLYFERKGAIATPQSLQSVGFQFGNTTIYSNFEYLTLPILFKIGLEKKRDPLKGRKVNPRFYLNAGPYFGILLSQTFVFENPDSLRIIQENTMNDKRLDIGISVGLGIELPITRRCFLTFEVRNNLGLYNISAVPVSGDGTIQTNSTNFIFGFSYWIIKKRGAANHV